MFFFAKNDTQWGRLAAQINSVSIFSSFALRMDKNNDNNRISERPTPAGSAGFIFANLVDEISKYQKVTPKWTEAVRQWLDNEQINYISPSLLSNCISTFYKFLSVFGLTKKHPLLQEGTGKKKNISIRPDCQIQNCMFIFLNAILIEECQAQDIFSDVKHQFTDSIVGGDAMVHNFSLAEKRIQDHGGDIFHYLPLFSIVLSSPLSLKYMLGYKDGPDDTLLFSLEFNSEKIEQIFHQLFKSGFGDGIYNFDDMKTCMVSFNEKNELDGQPTSAVPADSENQENSQVKPKHTNNHKSKKSNSKKTRKTKK